MIIGKIKADREAVIELEVVSLAQRVKVEAVIDTGFTGFLMLPSDLINRLNLPMIGKRNVLLADGNSVPLNLYRVKVIWHSVERVVYVLQSDTESLVGMSLLRGSRLTLDVVPDGDVTIAPLPSVR